MNPVQTWGQAIANSLIDLWDKFISFIPSLIGAILVFLLGLVIASVLGKVVERIFKTLHVDQAVERFIGGKLKETGIITSLSHFLGQFVYWFLVLVFLMASTEILGLNQVTSFLNSIILYLPNVVVATIILVIAFVIANFLFVIVRSSTRAAGVFNAVMLATAVKWTILIFGFLAALIQLGIATSLVNTIFIGLVAAFSLAIGLAFGLGGKDEAALLLKSIREHLTQK